MGIFKKLKSIFVGQQPTREPPRRSRIPTVDLDYVPTVFLDYPEVELDNPKDEPEEFDGDLDSPENRFLQGEVTYTPQSSNVAWIQYESGPEGSTTGILYIGYQDGSVYRYFDLTPDDALSLYAASSKGTWVWDNLRLRGTVFGFKVMYEFLDGPSKAKRKWHEAGLASRQRHGNIPASGEPYPGYHPADNYHMAQGKLGPNLGKKRGSKRFK